LRSRNLLPWSALGFFRGRHAFIRCGFSIRTVFSRGSTSAAATTVPASFLPFCFTLLGRGYLFGHRGFGNRFLLRTFLLRRRRRPMAVRPARFLCWHRLGLWRFGSA